jgi:hypothetical protein
MIAFASYSFNHYLLPGHLPWSMPNYSRALGKMYAGRDDAKEEALDALFPPRHEFSSPLNHFDSPCTIIDSEDNVLAWYLPDVISRDEQAMFNLLFVLYLLIVAYRMNGKIIFPH